MTNQRKLEIVEGYMQSAYERYYKTHDIKYLHEGKALELRRNQLREDVLRKKEN